MLLTEEQYLHLEREAKTKSEFHDGQIFAMAGSSPNHSFLASEIGALLRGQVPPGCRTFNSDLRIKAPAAGLYTYADCSVICGDLQYANDQRDVVLNPLLIVEVLSPSIEGYDRGKKFELYRTIPTFREYLIVHQETGPMSNTTPGRTIIAGCCAITQARTISHSFLVTLLKNAGSHICLRPRPAVARIAEMKIAFIALLFTTLLLQAASFEVAAIKPASPDEAGYSGADGRSGVLKIWNASLKRCIGYAYKIPEAQVLGGPKWIDELSYDILAKADRPAGEAELWTMLPSLLADRFKLQFHRETRTISGYTLTVAKGGIKATPADPTRHSFGNGGHGFIDSGASPLPVLTTRLAALLGKPVIDMTGDKRKFDFHLKWTPDDVGPATSDSPSLFTALQEQLGLKLESGKVQADVLIVDHAELPSDN